jgi:quercetin dioxygenase-like cupin family protein
LTLVKEINRTATDAEDVAEAATGGQMADPESKKLLTPATATVLADLVSVAPAATVSRVIARSAGGSVTLFAFAADQELSEHTAPFDALVEVLEGEFEVTIGETLVPVGVGQVVLMPAHVPHALRANSDAKMQLTMLRNPEGE